MFKTFGYKLWDLNDLGNHFNIVYSGKLNKMRKVLLRSLNDAKLNIGEQMDNEYNIIARSIKVVYYTHIHI